ncbi:MAG: tetratricopeptide repeat protein [Candidatus Omnitrophica bacterium]|nr:tetratricopeptide repeat protein [Candidatus Omnitrophota bacterium]
MTQHFDFNQFRLLIDEAITYDDLPRARALAKEALEALGRGDEHLGERMYFTAQILIIDEKFEEAIPCLDAAIKHNPFDGAVYNDRALCMIELGKLDGAMEFFDRGIAVEPDFATIHHNKGWFLNQMGHPAEALACFQQALELQPRRAVTYENMADCFYKLGQIPEAIGACQKAIEFLPEGCGHIRKEITQLISIFRRID